MRNILFTAATLCMLFTGMFSMPQITFAQGIGSGSCPTGTTPVKASGSLTVYNCVRPDGSIAGQSDPIGFTGATTSCEGTGYWWHFSTCIGRQIAVWIGTVFIWLTGWLLGVAGVLFNAALEFTTMGFDANIYMKIQGGIEAVWTAFRDIANILIIGMFTFIALTMILGIESFNAKRTVAKVLIIAVLINFSLLFTRLIISSSNFVATQFYKAAKFDSESATNIRAAGTTQPYGQYSAGISGKFAQLMGVSSTLDTKDSQALWKISESSDSGVMALLQGLLTAAVFLAASAVFLYAAFLLIARAILFIVLLITSSLAFASYLIPSGSIGGYGWSQWWSSLLKNAVFGPLLLIMLWATIQLGQGIKATNGSLGGLLADPAKGGNINALFSYLLVLGMLFASIKIATSFANKIGGFSWAAFVPALGAGFLARAGGFLGRQTLGRGGAYAGDYLATQAKASKSVTAQKMFDFGARQFAKAGKADFNIMRSQLGKEIAGVAQVKSIDALAGKTLGGFIGVQDQYKKQAAEQAKRLAYSEEEKTSKVKKELEAKKSSDPAFKAKYEDAEKAHEAAKQQLEVARKEAAIETGNITNKYKSKLETLEKERVASEQAFVSGTGSRKTRDDARKALKEETERQKIEMNIQANKIKRAQSEVNRAAQEFENLSTSVIEAAVKAGKLPEKFESAGEIAEKHVKSSFTSLLRSTVPTGAGVEKLAEKVGKEAGKPKVSKHETVNIARKVAQEKLGDEKKDKH